MLNVETAFQDLGINAIVGTEMLDLLGLTTSDLQFPQRFARLQSVISYFKDLPEDTRRFVITKATRGKMVNRLDHVFEYTNLLKEKTNYEKDLRETVGQLDKFKVIGDFDNAAIAQSKESLLKERVDFLQKELDIYEN